MLLAKLSSLVQFAKKECKKIFEITFRLFLNVSNVRSLNSMFFERHFGFNVKTVLQKIEYVLEVVCQSVKLTRGRQF